MLKPDAPTVTKAPRPEPRRPTLPTTCALCGEPCTVRRVAMEEGWCVQTCPCSGTQRRKLA